MFVKAKSRVGRTREKIVTLVLLAAFMVGTFPHPACICADGHREPFCRAALCRLLGREIKSAASHACSCCKDAHASEKSSCCGVTTSASPSLQYCSGPILIAKTDTCCQTFVESSALATAASK